MQHSFLVFLLWLYEISTSVVLLNLRAASLTFLGPRDVTISFLDLRLGLLPVDQRAKVPATCGATRLLLDFLVHVKYSKETTQQFVLVCLDPCAPSARTYQKIRNKGTRRYWKIAELESRSERKQADCTRGMRRHRRTDRRDEGEYAAESDATGGNHDDGG